MGTMMGGTAKVVFNIETLAYPLAVFDSRQQEYILKSARTEDERTDALLRLNLTPFTARVLAVAMLNPDTRRGRVLYQHPEGKPGRTDEGLIEMIPSTEEEILTGFWSSIVHYSRMITFNGRLFDCPFLMVRSALLGVAPTRNLVPYRFSASEHCDLLDQLSFYGATRRFNLDFYCRGFGVSRADNGGLAGRDLGTLFEAGRYLEIAESCLDDVKATAELFRRWEEYLAFEEKHRR